VLLVELNKSNELFTLAHRLVDRRPDWALSWYAVGCYYFAINNLTTAKRFLG
jgi:anaphase-promoting complex subunit 6